MESSGGVPDIRIVSLLWTDNYAVKYSWDWGMFMDFDGFSLDDDMFEGMMEHGSAMAALSMLHMQDELKDEAERVNPDTYGCDSIFVRNFVTPDMQADFPVIANAFYRNVPESLTFVNYDY